MQQIPISAANKNNCPSPSSQTCHCNRIMLPYSKTCQVIFWTLENPGSAGNLFLSVPLQCIVSFLSLLFFSITSVLRKRQAGQCSLLYSSTTGVMINLETTKSRHTFTVHLSVKIFHQACPCCQFLGLTISDPCRCHLHKDWLQNNNQDWYKHKLKHKYKTNTTLYELAGGSCTETKNRN